MADVLAVRNHKIRGDKREDETERTRHRIVDKQKWPFQAYEEIDHEKCEIQVAGKQRCGCGESVLNTSPRRKEVYKAPTLQPHNNQGN